MEEADPYPGLDMEERTYLALHDGMMKMYRDNDHKCLRVAAKLLTVSWMHCPCHAG